jgi:uncharacterized phage-like protein YoqJ
MKIGFTGHRPKKVFYNHDKAYTPECFELLLEFLHNYISKNEYLKDAEIFNTGGALGYDTAVAEVLFFYKCKVNLYLPYKSYGSNWYSNADRIRLEKHKHQANQVFYNCEDNTFCTSIMYERNKSIVDNSDVIIALWDGSKSGTQHCVDYAREQNNYVSKKVINIWSEWVNDYEN